ncbi:AT-hook motif nuclear-localized protein 14-like [Vigna unguiculata]|uniref:AT-hook motif nuclear-localized protein 14-like n=1 Tax=Vigna unguiculata TaxID=3917 RepID=UPI0010167987|nr:AT-hook motif nuclear-localized protein 14-like [Vigna unguiculata]
MENNGESFVFPPSPNPSETTNIPSPKEPNEQTNPTPEPQPEAPMVETAKSSEGSSLNSENESNNPTMDFPLPFTDDDDSEYPKPIIMIVPAGEDIVSTILDYARDQDVSILVHHASGSISEVSITNPLCPSSESSFRGNLHMFFLSGVYTKCLSPTPPKNVPFSFFNVQFSVEHAPEIYGGLVGNTLVAAHPVPVTATLFKEHEYYEYHGRVSDSTAPNVEPSILGNDPNATATATTTITAVTTDITDVITDDNDNNDGNTVYLHNGFFCGGSVSSPTDFSKLHGNNPTNPGDDN